MNWTPDLVARMDRYLAEVRQALSDRPEPVQHDICAELERQIREAMDALPETAHAAEALEAALARMDPPSAFVPAPEESPRTPARGGPRPSRPALFLAGATRQFARRGTADADAAGQARKRL